MIDAVTELEEKLAELNARYVMRPVGPHEEAVIAADTRRELADLGFDVTDHAWRDGEWGRCLDLRLAPKVDAVVIELAHHPV